MARLLRIFCLVLLFAAPSTVFAQPAQFDLVGPTLEVKVTHAGATLPISQTPNLAAGDQLWIKADLPPGQSVHYLLVAAFLRGSTNPPPANWFYRLETWGRKGQDGLRITVPQDAQQVLIFLAPSTGGDFGTLIGAVRGRPGAFVRASQDLNQATLDRSRLDTFLASVRKANPGDPDYLKTISPLLARSLAVKLNPDCFQKMPELQAACLMQGQDSLVLNDGHSTSIVQALTSGNPADLAMQLSASPQAGFGYYSPYVAAAFDIARIMDSLHTAQYQYIPALATTQGDQLSLLLNTPPSFHNPMSVLVAALPAVEPPQAPPLQPVDPKEVYCAERKDLVLPVVGAPLAFSTQYAHDMVLRLKGKDGKTVDLPVKADAEKGGFIADASAISSDNFEGALTGSLHGYWGFAPFDGPEFQLQTVRPQHWQVVADDEQSLIVGRDDVVHIQSEGAACVDSVMVQQASGEPEAAVWKAVPPNQLAVTVPLKSAEPGGVTLLVKQFGAKDADVVPLQAFAQAGHLDSFDFHAGDVSGVLKGTRLDEVAGLTLSGIGFKPGQLTTAHGGDELTLATSDPQAADKLKAGKTVNAKVALKDGRTVRLEVSVGSGRPGAILISKSVQPQASSPPNLIQLTGQDEVPQGAILTFSIHAQGTTSFSGDAKVEVAAADGTFLTTLTPTSGLVLEDSHVALAMLDTGKAFNVSAFGPLRFRIVDDQGASDWQPLATLVRLPTVHDLKCPAGRDQPCQLSGANLFLIDSLSSDAGFDHPVKVPEGFTGYVLPVPHPSAAGRLHVKLHDDPAVVNLISSEK